MKRVRTVYLCELFFCCVFFSDLIFNYVAVGARNRYALRGGVVRFFESLPLRLRAVKSYNFYAWAFEECVFARLHVFVVYSYAFKRTAIVKSQLAHFLHIFGECNRFKFKAIFKSFFFYRF